MLVTKRRSEKYKHVQIWFRSFPIGHCFGFCGQPLAPAISQPITRGCCSTSSRLQILPAAQSSSAGSQHGWKFVLEGSHLKLHASHAYTIMGADEAAWRAKAAANLLEARKKNGRLGAKKSRSGCITCKERRVKCDEERPECRRCLMSGRRCEGYSPSPASSASSPIPDSPSMALHVRDSEKRTYDYFLSCASHRLAGPFGKVKFLLSVLAEPD